MKKANKLNQLKLFLCFIFICSIGDAFAQSSSILEYFSISENSGKVYMSWTISSGSTCNGIQIYRSTDSIFYNEIGNIRGVCGNASYAQSYNFTDENPVKNKINYYRLQLGNSGPSQVLAVEIVDIESSGYQVRPNPVSDYAKIYFDNNTGQPFQLNLYDIGGKIILTLTSLSEYFELNSNTLPNGIYFFTISTPEFYSKLKGKIIVQH